MALGCHCGVAPIEAHLHWKPNDRITIMLSGLTQLFNNIYAFGGDFFSIAINLGL
ncbi:hypothetical protein ACFXK0_12360 [Nocardia sp. NPDC059177]|uniref:hypothetical protein n=1 Tax=Nocardia sp. NPDC059177 TaxID=3346759 RepID=UPI00367FF3F3